MLLTHLCIPLAEGMQQKNKNAQEINRDVEERCRLSIVIPGRWVRVPEQRGA